MRRFVLLTVLAAFVTAWVNCSNPLEPDENDGPILVVRHDTVVLQQYDTIVVEGDTLIDTLVDTLIDTLTDTLTDTITDTLINTITDTLVDTMLIPFGETYTICSIIHYNLNELIWIFDNEAGTYQLEFTATVSREFSARKLIVTIDGDVYTWDCPANSTFSIQLDLNEGVTIRIKPDVPLLLGHQVDLCLAMGQL